MPNASGAANWQRFFASAAAAYDDEPFTQASNVEVQMPLTLTQTTRHDLEGVERLVRHARSAVHYQQQRIHCANSLYRRR